MTIIALYLTSLQFADKIKSYNIIIVTFIVSVQVKVQDPSDRVMIESTLRSFPVVAGRSPITRPATKVTHRERPSAQHQSLDQDLGNPGPSVCTTSKMVALSNFLMAHIGPRTTKGFQSYNPNKDYTYFSSKYDIVHQEELT